VLKGDGAIKTTVKILVLLAFLISAQTAFADSNLIAHWKFDEGAGTTAGDPSGNSNDGIISGATWTTGQIEDALDFDGLDDRVSVPDNSSLDVSGAITVSAWVKVDVNSGKLTILAKTIGGGYYSAGGFFLAFRDDTGYSDGTFRLIFGKANSTSGSGGGNYGTNTSWDRVVSETNTWETGAWYHVAATWDGTTNSESMKMYINGLLNATHAAGQATMLTNKYPLQIGRILYEEPWNQFDGKIDDVRIYNRDLSAGEIEKIYKDGIGSKAFSPDPFDGATGMDLNIVLIWSPGIYAASHNVYFGTDNNDVNNADVNSPQYMGNFGVNSFDPCGLDFLTTYYWRVDEINEPNVWKGDVWTFNTGDADERLYVPLEYPTIQAAINASVNGDIVIVAPGNYTGPGNRDIDFLGKAITVKGAGPNDPCMVAATVIDCNGSEAELHRGFYFHSGESVTSVVSGLTITNGYSESGGAIYLENSGATISNCRIIGNKTKKGEDGDGAPGGDGGNGGGICSENSLLEIENCIIRDNITGNGGRGSWITEPSGDGGGGAGVYCGFSSGVVIEGCKIINNRTGRGGHQQNIGYSGDGGDGGGVCCDISSSLTISDSNVSSNETSSGGEGTRSVAGKTGRGGGIYCVSSEVIDIGSCVITNNRTGDGASNFTAEQGVDGGDGAGVFCSEAVIRSSTISNNVTGDGSSSLLGSRGGNGGGIYCDSAVISNCNIFANITGDGSDGYESGGDGGNGAGIFCSLSSLVTIELSTIAENIAGLGGICYGSGSNGNRGEGAGVYANADTVVANSIIWGNEPNQLFGQDCNNINYCNIADGICSSSFGNIDTDPCFVDTDANDFHLKSSGWRWDTTRQRWDWDDVTSRCIDAGNPGSPLVDELLSIPGDPNNEWGQNLRINMGAFGRTPEASMPPYDWALLSDITNDGISDFNDLKILSSLWLDTGGSLYADFNRDEIVDFLDFAILADDWFFQTTWR